MKKRLVSLTLVLAAILSLSLTVYAGPIGGIPPVNPNSIELPIIELNDTESQY
ncbi:MAG: hypothetical protein FWB74_05675 [Defluviitaleaceae bacterium]|nr:hypothetical protein [Defluviitaleaceae bacterium]